MLEYLMTNHRWFFVVFFLMPMSMVYELYLFLRNTWSFYLRKKAPEKHAQRVKKIAENIKAWSQGDRKQKMCSARPAWQTMSLRAGKYKKTYKNISLQLHEILEINVEKKTCRVEPMVTAGQLTHFLLPLGWTLPVIPELDDLTMGGLISGVGIETSSHKYGLFQHICVSFEVILSDGSVVTCSAEDNSDLFYSIPWAHGTLGFVVAAEIKIVPCKSFVDLTYIPFHNKTKALERFKKESEAKNYEFVECLAFSPSEYVVMMGDMADHSEDIKVNKIGLWYKPWFYIYVKKMLKSNEARRELIPLRDYYHRHTRSLFWEVQDIIPFGNHILFRFLFGWMMPPKPSLMKLAQTEALRKLYELHHVVQDMLIPMDDISDCLTCFDAEISVYPLWLCPFILPSNAKEGVVHRGMVGPTPGDKQLFVDVGAYGNPTVKNFVAKDTCQRLEKFVRDHHGYQMMYADSYMTREEFREMFDHSLYDQVRRSIPYCEDAFPEVYDKVSKAARI